MYILYYQFWWNKYVHNLLGQKLPGLRILIGGHLCLGVMSYRHRRRIRRNVASIWKVSIGATRAALIEYNQIAASTAATADGACNGGGPVVMVSVGYIHKNGCNSPSSRWYKLISRQCSNTISVSDVAMFPAAQMPTSSSFYLLK